MDLGPEVSALAVDLAAVAARNTASAAQDKIKSLRQAKRDTETINGLDDLVNELLADKAELVRLAQRYQAELVAQTLTAGDVQYIVSTVLPLVRRLVDAGGEEGAGAEATMALLQPLLSIEMVNVLQLLGFSFKDAVGVPLTRLVAGLIAAKTPPSAAAAAEAQALLVQRDIALARIAADEEAASRLLSLR